MGQTAADRVSYVNVLTVHRELLVSRLQSLQCLLDNLSACGFFCEEDADIVQQTVTRTEKVGGPKTSQMLEEASAVHSVRSPLGGAKVQGSNLMLRK